MDNEVDVVARALFACVHENTSDNFDGSKYAVREFYRRMARAAIAAMREPTAKMLEAGDIAYLNNEDRQGEPLRTSSVVWKAMADAALKVFVGGSR